MKAISLTVLTILTSLFLVHLFTSPPAVSRITSPEAAGGASLRSGLESAPLTGNGKAPALSTMNYPPEPLPSELVPDYAQGTSQTAIDAPTPVAASVLSEEVDAGMPAADQTAPGGAQNVPASTGLLAEPLAAAQSPLEVAVAEPQSPQLEAFIKRVVNGQAGQVVGVFVQDALALPVVQQPAGQANYVSTADNRVTQFATPMVYGTIGLLAHNYLSGRQFFKLSENQEAIIVFGDGQQQAYRITRVQRYQALDPENAYSNFVGVNDPAQTVISAADLFGLIYSQPNTLVFQTCIEANGNSSWGRLFITAEKVGG